LLLGITLVGLALGWGLHKVRRQSVVIAAIERAGGAAYERPRRDSLTALECARSWIGDKRPLDVDTVSLDDSEVSDADLVFLRDLPKLLFLQMDRTEITDAGLVHLEPLTHLDILSLNQTRVTDAGLSHLQLLTELNYLSLAMTQVTDAGLVHLRRMKRLGTLDLSGTKVTDAGVEKLQASHPGLLVER
jgi:hypothetical protein